MNYKREEKVKLVFTNWKSDKVYNLFLQSNDDKDWIVIASYGKYGNVNRKVIKTSSDSVSYYEAKEVYDKILDQKLKKGYSIEN